MATDNWPIPEDDAAEQAASITPDGDGETPRQVTDADEADTLEQSHEVPEDDEYRDQ